MPNPCQLNKWTYEFLKLQELGFILSFTRDLLRGLRCFPLAWILIREWQGLFVFFLICWSFEEALIIFLTSCVIIHPSSTGTCFARKFALALKAWNFVSCSGHAEQRGTLLSFVLIPGHAWGVWVTLGLSSEAIGGLNTLRLRELNILQNGQHRHEGRG